LTNASRHSHSEKVRVTLWRTNDRVCVEVQDWGVGFDPSEVPQGHFGLQGIRERVRLLDGVAAIQAAPQQGVRVTVELPLPTS
jgi:signal transduction histidine kinase